MLLFSNGLLSTAAPYNILLQRIPRITFLEEVSSITDIFAQTKVSILFAIVVAAHTKNGKQILLDDAHLTED